METLFTADFFRGNRQKLRTLFTGTAPIVITANGLLQRNGDNNFLFRQDSGFWYLTGLDIPDAVLVMDKDREYVILPAVSPIDEVFGLPLDVLAIQNRCGIEEVIDNKDGWKRLERRLKRVKHIATLAALPSYVEHYGFYANPARGRLIERLKDIQPEAELLDLREHLARMRMIKQAPELLAIQKAIDITVRGIKIVSRRLSGYEYEYEIEADLTREFRGRGAQGHGFNPVIASGRTTAHHLHATGNGGFLKNARHLYIDVGAEYENYSADITRTYFLKPPTKREKAIYDAVKDVQEFAKNQLKPGISIRENEKNVEHYMGEKLRELGLIKTIDKQSVRKYYTHSCSHYLGLDTHDAGDTDAPLKPGMVLTVEPGIYVREEDFGVRIEDDVLVTDNGVKVLTAKLPSVPSSELSS